MERGQNQKRGSALQGDVKGGQEFAILLEIDTGEYSYQIPLPLFWYSESACRNIGNSAIRAQHLSQGL